ncbi:lipase family protein [uncultured Sanguibacteroides sp.]|uniref:lipase family protein n=1 Tax=uncultured Sanguibacteroides sp. TaxID=1635151 RepID=UPI0025FAC97E|nr:lipase family protein [uncultured Sanguibacteroides sp.]
MKKFLLFSVIGLLLLHSCSKDEESISPRYFVSVIQEKEFSVKEIKNRYPEIFTRYSSLSFLLQNIHVTTIRYRTKDCKNQDIIASGVIAYPSNKNINGVTSVQHSSLFLKSQAPSRQLLHFELAPVLFKQVVFMADYIGFGETEHLFHPFFHSNSTAQSCLDMIRAGKEYLQSIRFSIPEEISLMGYSQGGNATLALLKKIEEIPATDLKVKQTFAGGGAYDLEATYNYFLNQNYISQPAFVPYLILGLNTGSRLQLDWNEIFISPDQVIPLFNGNQDLPEINMRLGHWLEDILSPAFFLPEKNNSIKKLEKALRQNSLVEWTPNSSLTLMHSPDDTYVPYLNAEHAFHSFQQQGCRVNFVSLQGDHSSAGVQFYLQVVLKL